MKEEKEPVEVEVKRRGEPKWIEERTVRYSGFETAEEAKKFLEDMKKDFEETERFFERMFSSTRELFLGIDRMLDWWRRPSIDTEIESLERRLEYLKKEKKALEDKRERR